MLLACFHMSRAMNLKLIFTEHSSCRNLLHRTRAEQHNLNFFAHGSDTSGIEIMIRIRFLAPTTIADGPEAVGHYSQATPWNDDMSYIQTQDRVTNSGKWQYPVIT